MNRMLFTAAVLLVVATGARAQGFDDEFNSLIPMTGWSWLREDRSGWLLTGAELQITTQQGALNGMNYNDVKNILLQSAPAGVFRCETKVTFSPDSSFHNAGLIYYIDDDNYVRISRGVYQQTNGPLINGVWMEWEINGLTDFSFLDSVTVNPIYLRLSRNPGSLFRSMVSVDGVHWRIVHQETVLYSTENARIGIQAANGQGILVTTLRIPAIFDYFRVSATSVEDAAPSAAAVLAIDAVAPQPARAGSAISVSYSSAAAGVRCTLTDMLGRAAWSADADRFAGTHTISIATAGLAPGIYTLHLSGGGQQASRRVALIR